MSDFGGNEQSDKVVFIKRDKRADETPASEVYDLARVLNALKSDLAYVYPEMEVDSLVRQLDLPSFIVPNLFFDENTTQLVHREAVNYISPTKGMVYAGQLIVSEGETVTGEICEILDSYKEEYRLSYGYSGSQNALLISHLFLVLILLAVFFFAVFFLDRSVFSSMPKLLFLRLQRVGHSALPDDAPSDLLRGRLHPLPRGPAAAVSVPVRRHRALYERFLP